MKKISIFLGLFTLFADQMTKFLAVKYLSDSIATVKVFDFFNLVLVYNKGISFGMFNQTDYSNYVFTVLSLIITCFLLKWFKDSVILAEYFSLSLIIGGALGNVIDRIIRPGVVDFIQLHWQEYYWPNFNVADSAICLGVIILIIISLKNSKRDSI